MSKLDRYKKDLDSLIATGQQLQMSIALEYDPSQVRQGLVDKYSKDGKTLNVNVKVEEILQNHPRFNQKYQSWYSESKSLIRQLLPDRLDDFTRHYEKPKTRKSMTFENYVIEDYFAGTYYHCAVSGEESSGNWGRSAALSTADCDTRISKGTFRKYTL